MVSYSNLGKIGHGRLGNQLFQIASCIGLAESFGTDVGFGDWEYEKYFEKPLPKGRAGKSVKEQHFHYDLSQFNSDCDITGWMQSEKYFEHCKDRVSEQLRFRFDFKKGLAINNKIFDKETIAISVRRGDYVNNPNYVLLPPSYYVGALVKHFPEYENYNIIIFSDDIDYCKVHFQCLSNVHFAEGNAIEQLCLMSMCSHFIIANSTFSWWGAWLGEKTHSKIIKPNYHFGYDFGLKNNAKDYYPERWIAYDHKQKIDLSDTTFIIPVSYDSKDREENLNLVLKNLRENFDCKIIVGEQGGNHFEYVNEIYAKFEDVKFHRTKMLNAMTKISGTPIVINYDADVLIPPLQIYEAVKKIRAGADFVYPYDGRFARVPRTYYEGVESFNDVGILCNQKFKGTIEGDSLSVGGAIAYNKESFWKAGWENENFISYGEEDVERYHRFNLLGFKVERMKGILYHIDHVITPNSSTQHKDYNGNHLEWKRIQKMSKAQLESEVSKWYNNKEVGLNLNTQ